MGERSASHRVASDGIDARRRPGVAVVLLLLGLGAGFVVTWAARSDAAPTCTKTWIGPAGGDYADPAHWNPVGVPAPTDWLCDGGASDRIVVTDTRSANGATLHGELDLAGGAMTFTRVADHTTLAKLSAHGGSLAGAATVDVTGTAELQWGALSGSGSLVLGAGSVSSVGRPSVCCSALIVGRPVVNHGSLSVVGFGGYVGFSGGSLTNDGVVSFSDDGAGLYGYSGSNAVVNTGTITKTGAGSNTIDVPVSGAGGFVVGSGGTLSVAAGGVPASGDVTLSGGGTLALSSGTYEVDDLSVSGAGTTLATTGGTWHSAGVVSVGSGAGAQLTGGGLAVDGSATFAAGTNLVVEGGTLSGAGATTVVGTPVASTVDLSWGALSGSGSLVLGAGSVSSVGRPSVCCSALIVGRPVVNHGSLSVVGVGGYVGFSGGSLTNDGVVSFSDDGAGLYGYSGSNAVVNTGTITKTGAGSNTIDIPIDNGGVVSSTGGELSIAHVTGYDGSGTLSGGTWSASAGGTVRLGNVHAVTTADAVLAVDGSGSSILNAQGLSVLAGLTTVTPNGGVTLRNDQSLTLPGPLTTAGTVTVGATSSLSTTGLFTQNGGETRLESSTAGLTATGSWVEVRGGRLGGVGTVAPALHSTGGTIAPGTSPGILNVAGPVELGPTGRVEVEINGATAGSGYDRLQASGAVSVDGTLAVTRASTFAPSVGQSFDVVTGSSRSGSFSGVAAASAGTGKAFDVTYPTGAVRLTVVAVPGPDLTIATQALGKAFNVGHPGTWRTVVSNVGGSASSGTVTVSLALGSGQSFSSASGTGWSCSGTTTVTCTRSGAVASGASAPAIDLVVDVDAAALPTTGVSTSVSGGGDTRPGNNTFVASVAAKNLAPPVALLLVTPTKGTAPVSITADSSPSAGSIDTRSIDWGDGGATSSAINASHTYLLPGTYTVTLRVGNDVQDDTTTKRITVVENVPLKADAGDDRTAAPGLTLQLDGGASTPSNAIDTYTWNFGDGNSSAPSATPVAFHAYTNPGTYTATLSVVRGAEVATDTVVVTVKPAVGSGLFVDVRGGGSLLPGADVTVIDAHGVRYSASTSLAGTAMLRGLPDGRYTVYAFADGYVPGLGQTTVVGGNGTASFDLASGALATQTLESRRLSYDEIIAAGIDPSDPANQNVFEFDICLAFGDYSCIQFSGIGNGAGELLGDPYLGDPGGVGGGGGGGGVGTCWASSCSYDLPGGRVTAQFGMVGGQPSGTFLMIPGRAKWLKEFFEVKMAIVNLAPAGFTFEDGVATLDLPAGLALAPTGDPQSLDVDLEDIPGGESRAATWIVRGDEQGEYDLSASYSGTLDPLGRSIKLDATTSTPLKVWGFSAVEMTVTADDAAVAHEPYRFTLTLTNVTAGTSDPASVYNPVLAIDEDAGGANYIVQPGERFEQGVDELAPGESFSADFVVIPVFSGELNVAGSAVLWAGGDAAPASRVLPPQARHAALGVTPTPQPGAVTLDWTPTPGAVSYRVHRTITDTTRFPVPEAPLVSVGAPTTTATVSAPPGPQWYAISSIDANGVSTMHHELIQVAPLPPPPLNLSVGDASVVEGDNGKPRSVQFAVTLSEPATSEVTVGYTLLPGSATVADFNNNKGATKTLRIRPGATGVSNTVYYITAKVTPDVEIEGNHTFTVQLSNPTGGFGLGSSTAVATVLDDDPGSGLRASVGDASIWEGDVGKSAKAPNNAKVWVNLSAPATETVTVQVDVAPGTASVGTDYKAFKRKTLTFEPGQYQKSIAIGAFADTLVEGDETVTIMLSNPTGGLGLGRSQGTVTVRNDD